jgi:phage terminase large subunit
MTSQLALTYQPRPYQKNIIKALNSGIKRAVWCVHRRAGKDLTIFNWVVFYLLSNPGHTCYYVLPTYSQGKKIIWEGSTIDGKRILSYIPEELIEQKSSQDLKIRFTNGSLFQIIGSDNIDSVMGVNAHILVFSEFALQSHKVWELMGPIIKVSGGYAIFISTPRGKNHFYDLVNMARDNKEKWFLEILSIKDTGVLTEKDMEEERKTSSEEMIQQEYYCSFNRGVEGSYYARLIEKARQENRICNVPWETRSNVNTAWDLGIGDSTSITFWQDIGGEVRIIDYYEMQGEPVVHYAKILQNKPYVYGTHYFPHDAGNRGLETARTIQDAYYEVGIKSIVLERERDIGPGIEAVRSMLSIAYIDAEKCRHLIKCLENYRKNYNEKTNSYSEQPVHDWCSHCADSVRYMAMAKLQYGKGPGTMTKDSLTQLKAQAGYGPKRAPMNGPNTGINRPFGR